MAYIGLISDTHGYFDEKLRKFLEPVDVVWHAGDFGTGAVAQEIAAVRAEGLDGFTLFSLSRSAESVLPVLREGPLAED